ncbi:ATP-binding protein [Leptospira selangorensis]|uniref:ATP-binding protein n=1 Tax=Leptospira selangorensis TaxID=2484982 RepID=A0A5F2C0E7_9LEPT|nr:ATP-binding protein [Leptospira selangorensis]TGM15570.1 ATP-binding protein [Leptospira selangorensis]TGM18480.1 ATP-binding protein [Leptospira selangorensis]
MTIDLEIIICSVFIFLSTNLFWLGSTTGTNLEKKNAAAYFSIFTLLVSSLLFSFFAILGQNGFLVVSAYPILYFFPGLILLILIPFGWFVVIVWFFGFLKKKGIFLFLFYILSFCQLVSIFILLIYNPGKTWNISLFEYWKFVPFSFKSAYLIYIFTCVFLSLLCLFLFKISDNSLSELGRQKSVPFLKGIGFSLFGVVLLVSVLFVGDELGIIENLIIKAEKEPKFFYGFVLCIQLLICISILVLGWALTSYEILTGRILPKISLKQEWKNSVYTSFVLACLYFLFAKLGYPRAEIFIVFSYSFFLSRFFTVLKNKQVSSNQNEVLKKILSSGSVKLSFGYLCRDVLETRKAALIFQGKIPYISDTNIFYPENIPLETFDFSKLDPNPENPNIQYLDKDRFSGFVIRVKIESVLSGDAYLILGQKENGGLFAEEEIEIARITGTWLVHSLFLEETGNILEELQRKKIQEQRLSDQKTRQILHDEILPEIHSLILEISNNKSGSLNSQYANSLTELHKRISSLLREMSDTGLEISRLGLIPMFQKLQDSDAKDSDLIWEIDPKINSQSEKLPPEVQEVLYYAFRESLRNAVKYSGDVRSQIVISIRYEKGLSIQIKNEIGKDLISIRSSGQGLKIHSALLKIFQGSLTLEFPSPKEAMIRIFLPSP